MKKGQAGLEFLMTYGWAILVVIIAISALIFFEVIKMPDSIYCKDNPENCVCEDSRLKELIDIQHCINGNLDEDYVKFRKLTDLEYCNINFLDAEKCICEGKIEGYTYLRLQRNDNGRFINFRGRHPALLSNVSGNIKEIYNVSIEDTVLIDSDSEVIGCLTIKPR